MDKRPMKDPAPPPLAELERASQDLKARIVEARLKSDMPINATLGNPEIDARNADGRNDVPDDEDA